MSVYMMSMVFKRYSGGVAEMLLALALADHADDDGVHIFPTVEALATKTRQSVRTVQRQLKNMVDDGWLIPVGKHGSHRYSPNEYRINPDWIEGKKMESSGPEKAPQNPEIRGDNLSPLDDSGVTPEVVRGDNCVTQEHIINHHYGSSNEEPAPNAEKLSPKVEKINPVRLIDGRFSIDPEVYERFDETYPGIDLETELGKAELWLDANPARRKKNLKAFLVNWLGRAQQAVDQATARAKVFKGAR